MDLKGFTFKEILGFVIFDLVILQFIYYPFIRRQEKKGKGKYFMWGNYLTVLGIVLTTFGIFLDVLILFFSFNKGIDFGMLLAFSLPLLVGIPSLIIGIFLVHNP